MIHNFQLIFYRFGKGGFFRGGIRESRVARIHKRSSVYTTPPGVTAGLMGASGVFVQRPEAVFARVQDPCLVAQCTEIKLT